MARPIELTDAVADQIAGGIADGMPVEEAAALAGIRRETVWAWGRRGVKAMRRAERSRSEIPREEEIFVRFSNAIQKARAKAIQERVETIKKNDDWQAAAWWLERMCFKRFGRRTLKMKEQEPKQPERVFIIPAELASQIALEVNKERSREIKLIEGNGNH